MATGGSRTTPQGLKSSVKLATGDAKVTVFDKRVIESIKEATGASDVEVRHQLELCGGDVNKATENLIDYGLFTVVQSKQNKISNKYRNAGRGAGGRSGGGGGRMAGAAASTGAGRNDSSNRQSADHNNSQSKVLNAKENENLSGYNNNTTTTVTTVTAVDDPKSDNNRKFKNYDGVDKENQNRYNKRYRRPEKYYSSKEEELERQRQKEAEDLSKRPYVPVFPEKTGFQGYKEAVLKRLQKQQKQPNQPFLPELMPKPSPPIETELPSINMTAPPLQGSWAAKAAAAKAKTENEPENKPFLNFEEKKEEEKDEVVEVVKNDTDEYFQSIIDTNKIEKEEEEEVELKAEMKMEMEEKDNEEDVENIIITDNVSSEKEENVHTSSNVQDSMVGMENEKIVENEVEDNEEESIEKPKELEFVFNNTEKNDVPSTSEAGISDLDKTNFISEVHLTQFNTEGEPSNVTLDIDESNLTFGTLGNLEGRASGTILDVNKTQDSLLVVQEAVRMSTLTTMYTNTSSNAQTSPVQQQQQVPHVAAEIFPDPPTASATEMPIYTSDVLSSNDPVCSMPEPIKDVDKEQRQIVSVTEEAKPMLSGNVAERQSSELSSSVPPSPQQNPVIVTVSGTNASSVIQSVNDNPFEKVDVVVDKVSTANIMNHTLRKDVQTDMDDRFGPENITSIPPGYLSETFSHQSRTHSNNNNTVNTRESRNDVSTQVDQPLEMHLIQENVKREQQQQQQHHHHHHHHQQQQHQQSQRPTYMSIGVQHSPANVNEILGNVAERAVQEQKFQQNVMVQKDDKPEDNTTSFQNKQYKPIDKRFNLIQGVETIDSNPSDSIATEMFHNHRDQHPRIDNRVQGQAPPPQPPPPVQQQPSHHQQQQQPQEPQQTIPEPKPVSAQNAFDTGANSIPTYNPQQTQARHPQVVQHQQSAQQPQPQQSVQNKYANPVNQNPNAVQAHLQNPHVSAPLIPSINQSTLPTMPPQQLPFGNPGMMPNPAALPYPPNHPYYPQYMQYQHQMYHGMYAGTYGGFGGPPFQGHESMGYPTHVLPPTAVLPSQVNQAFPVSFPNTLYALGNYEMPNAGTFQDKEKENAFLAQQQAQHQQFNGQPPQQGPRNDMFYGLPQQNFNQGFRNQFHQQGFPGQFPTAGNFMVPPHKYHNNNQPNNNFRLH